ncbi:MAG: two-component regulator propeller domain-containing protein [Chitinophagaceae bacterium]
MKISPVSLLLLLAFAPCRLVHTQDLSYTLQRIDSRNGLSNSSLNAIYQGNDKVLWVGTWDGLNAFNGYSFKTFNYNQLPGKGLRNNVVEEIVEDAERTIWISTVEGVSRYKPSSGEFSHYFYSSNAKQVSEKQFLLFTDRDKTPYIYSAASGVQQFDYRTSSFIPLPIDLPNKNIRQLLFSENGDLWVLLNDGRLGSFTIRQHAIQPKHSPGYRNNIHSIHALDGNLLVVSNTGNIERITTNEQIVLKRFNSPVRAIIPYEGHYIVALEKKGCRVVDKDFHESRFLEGEIASLQESQITTIFAGTDKTIWFGTDGSGMARLSPVRRAFTAVSNASVGLKDKQVRTFERVGTELWVGTKGNGILAFPWPWSSAITSHVYSEADGLSNNAVYTIRKINDTWTYIGSDGDGLLLYNQHKKRFVQWNEVKGSAPSFRSVYSILPDTDGSVWLGTSGYGLIHLRIDGKDDPSLVYFKQYQFTGNDSGPASDIIFSVAKDQRNRIWLGCRYGGVSIMDTQTGRFTTIRSGSDKNGLSHNDVLALLADRSGSMWIGTSFGLNRVDADYQGKAVQHFTTTEGLPNNTIHGIAEDSQGMIWVSTNNGLARLNSKSNDMMRFREPDGLQSNEFSDGAVWNSNQGTIFFGGINGFNYCEPAKLTVNSSQPNLQITNLKFGGEIMAEGGYRVLEPGTDNIAQEFTLSRHHNYFDLSLNTIDFTSPGRSEFAYRLDGFDKNWHYPGSSGYISYGNLPAGDYTLKIKWSNGEGRWTNEQSLCFLTVEQYLWLTPAAFLLYYVLSAIFIYVIYTYRKSKTEMKHQLEMEYQLRLKEEKLHAEKLDFFTNIAHELQTPLTLIMGSVEHQQQQQASHPTSNVLGLVHQQASRLAYLIEQLMEFRKAEEGYLRADRQLMDASAFFSSIARLFIHFREQSGIDYNYEIQEGIFIDNDPDKLEKITFNLLSNAFKYTSPGEKIYFRVCRNDETSSLELSVANSGHDISSAEMQKLFDRFFTGNSSQKFSSGLGLAFTKQLVQVLDGNMQAYCKNNWACFEVNFPLQHVDLNSRSSIQAVQPSLLIRTIAKAPPQKEQLSAAANNKEALLQSLEQDQRPVILIVEDEVPIRQLIRQVLGKDFLIYEASNGREALACMTRLIPHLIITDIMMDDMNGLELCKKIKHIPDTCHVPVLMLSARGSIEQQQEGYEAGADAYLPKPFHNQHLLARVNQLLDNRRRLHDYFRSKAIPGAEPPQGMDDADRAFLEHLLQIINADLTNCDLDASDLESAMAMSRMQLYRKIKTISGMTPAEFIRTIRLQKAAALLETTKLTVSEIFYQTGFNNQSYFFREFKKKYQTSPNEYRNANKVAHTEL